MKKLLLPVAICLLGVLFTGISSCAKNLPAPSAGPATTAPVDSVPKAGPPKPRDENSGQYIK